MSIVAEITAPAGAPPDRRKGRLHGVAVTNLRDMIASGRLAPGTRLRETWLAETLHLSRTPLREALRTLAREGLVTILPNRSAVVAGLDLTEVEALFHAVGHLEALAGRLACTALGDAAIAEIAAVHDRMTRLYTERRREEYLALNAMIHRALVQGSGNPVLLELWDLLAPRVRRARSLGSLDPARWAAALAEHEAMLDALRRRDGERLGALMVPHYLNALPTIGALTAAGP
jgi:DNA-binding GntR family transcriptional regulator